MRPRRALVAMVALAVTTGCTAPPSTPATPTSSPASVDARTTPSRGPATPDGDAWLKPVLTGLLDRQGVPRPANAHGPLVSGIVVNLTWRELEPDAPTPDGASFHAIEDQLDAMTRYASAHGMTLRARLRIVTGVGTPEWVLRETGSVSVHHTAPAGVDRGADDFAGDLPYYWNDRFAALYAELQQRLAARYDSDPRIADVVVGRCATRFAETFVRQASPGFVGPLFGVPGTDAFTVAKDRACIIDQLEPHARYWRHTRSTFALNPYQVLTPAGRGDSDLAFTLSAMRACRDRLGQRCVLANNSLSDRREAANPEYSQLYQAMSTTPPLTFQTAKEGRFDSLHAALAAGIGHGACAIELPAGYDRTITAEDLRADRAALEARCPTG